LASYCQSEPNSLVLQAEAKGKPKLIWPANNICFNLSHSGGLALLAITENRRVGVDLEIVNPSTEVADLSRRFFAPAEARQILALPPEAQAAAFFACWTRKEAFLKAIGLGLSAPLDGFEVTLGPDPIRLISADSIGPGEWCMVDISEPGVAAAVAVEGHMPALRHFRFEDPS
jgi:4'-phosphopantetheinyl transferase